MWKNIFIFLILSTLLLDEAMCKKKKLKRPKKVEEPEVATYSSYGFNDVIAQSDFKPSSMALSGPMGLTGPDTTTMGLYAPAFPTAEDTTPFNIFASNGQVSQSFSPYLDGMASSNQDSGKYQSYSYDYRNQQQGFEDGQDSRQHDYDNYDPNTDAPIYGTKINSKVTTPKPSLYGDALNYQNIYNYASTWPTTNIDNLGHAKPVSSANYKDTFKSATDFSNYKGTFQTDYNDNTYAYPTVPTTKDTYSQNKLYFGHNTGKNKDVFDFSDDNSFKTPTVNIVPKNVFKNNYNYSDDKYNFKNTALYSSYKDRYKPLNNKPTEPSNYNSLDFGGWQSSAKPQEDYSRPKDHMKYNNVEYSGTKHSYRMPEPDYTTSETMHNTRNVIDFTGDNNPFKDAYQDNEFNSGNYSTIFKQMMDGSTNLNSFTNNVDYTNVHSPKSPKIKHVDADPTKNLKFDFSNPTKNSYFDNIGAASTQYWGNAFKSYQDPTSNSYSKYKKPIDNENADTIIHIPKKSQAGKFPYGKYGSGKHKEAGKISSSLSGKTIDEWNKAVSNRFKSEEELLGLRNHDTSRPSYLPTYKLNEELNGLQNYASNFDYGGAIEKWRYLHLKSKDPASLDPHASQSHSYGHSSSHTYPKQYQIEIPHPVFVPVPQPYPVRVPVPKPIAVPVVRELTVPVERPVPYPVIKNVPYPVERPVPVPIERPVPVPVMKPYPVPIPHVRPVFHHSRPRPPRDESDSFGDPDTDEEFRWRDQDEEFPPHREHRERHVVREQHRPEPMRSESHRDEIVLRPISTERIHIRPAKMRRPRIRPRRPTAQARASSKGTRRPQRRRSPPTGNTYRRQNPRSRGFQSKEPKPAKPTGKHAHSLHDHSAEDHDHDHDHDDYFKYCQNNPMCYIQSLTMPVMN